jgi:Fe-S-cluster-containing dehydrogenase component
MSDQKRYGLAIDSKRCIDCKGCVVACRAENKVPVEYSRPWISRNEHGQWPRMTLAFEPEQCHQCAEPACVRVCPTGASYQRADGVVAIKQSDCVGCRYCIIACPFEARFFREDKGIVEKCDFCSQRLERGETPACVETCPSKVRIFGDLNDPKSRISEVLAKRQFRVKKREAGTLPQIYYLG